VNNIQSVKAGTLDVGHGPIYFSDDWKPLFGGNSPDDASPLETTELIKPRVLVVDDEKLIADTCAQILENAGLDARIAYEGWSALEMLAAFKPDYLLTDVLMPGMNGVQLAIAVKKTFPDVNILLFSGQAGISEILLEGHEQGYEFELLAKPLHPSKLLEHFKKK